MTAAEIVQKLKQLESESIKKVLLKHGIKEPLLGVKIEKLKKIQKRIKKDLQHWVDTASCNALCGFTVSWVAAESQHG